VIAKDGGTFWVRGPEEPPAVARATNRSGELTGDRPWIRLFLFNVGEAWYAEKPDVKTSVTQEKFGGGFRALELCPCKGQIPGARQCAPTRD